MDDHQWLQIILEAEAPIDSELPAVVPIDAISPVDAPCYGGALL